MSKVNQKRSAKRGLEDRDIPRAQAMRTAINTAMAGGGVHHVLC
jgi:hypothetical protein